MKNNITHICSLGRGGVSDYIDILIDGQQHHIKKCVHQKNAHEVPLTGTVVLHYSGYGYAKRGAPLWLLKKIKAERGSIERLGIFFHELYAFGKPWSSAFWLSPLQRYIARELAVSCDFWVTNSANSERWLKQYAANKPNRTLPVFSTIGEMLAYQPERKKNVIVFGLAPLRAACYRAHANKLSSFINDNNLQLHDIGPAITDSDIQQTLNALNVTQHGRLEKEEISSIMSDARYGIIHYPHSYVTKSSVFAAYCAHGMCPIVLDDQAPTSEESSRASIYFLNAPPKIDQPEGAAEVGRRALQWYQSHTADIQRETFTLMLSNSVVAP